VAAGDTGPVSDFEQAAAPLRGEQVAMVDATRVGAVRLATLITGRLG
jgi:hypothetical protein